MTQASRSGPTPPAAASPWAEDLAVLVVELGEAHRELERDRRAPGQVLVLEERDPLLVAEGDAVELEAAAPPMRHGRVRRRALVGRQLRVQRHHLQQREAGLVPRVSRPAGAYACPAR